MPLRFTSREAFCIECQQAFTRTSLSKVCSQACRDERNRRLTNAAARIYRKKPKFKAYAKRWRAKNKSRKHASDRKDRERMKGIKDKVLDLNYSLQIDSHGYARRGGFMEHILIAERVLGKPLPPKAIVHHVDGKRANNENNNLVICPNQAYHKMLHRHQRIRELGGHWKTHSICANCGLLPITEFSIYKESKTHLDRIGVQAYRIGTPYTFCKKCNCDIQAEFIKNKRNNRKD